MKTATVKLRHKRKGRIITVNQEDWAHDLGRYKYRDYDRVGEVRGDKEAEADPKTTSGVKLLDENTPESSTDNFVGETVTTGGEITPVGETVGGGESPADDGFDSSEPVDEPVVSVDAIIEARKTLDAQPTPTENRMDGEGNTNAPAVKALRGRPPRISK